MKNNADHHRKIGDRRKKDTDHRRKIGDRTEKDADHHRKIGDRTKKDTDHRRKIGDRTEKDADHHRDNCLGCGGSWEEDVDCPNTDCPQENTENLAVIPEIGGPLGDWQHVEGSDDRLRSERNWWK
jgi:hypothetical protein